MTALTLSIPGRGLRSAWRFVIGPGWSKRIGVFGMLAIILAAIFAPWLTPYDPTAISPRESLSPRAWSTCSARISLVGMCTHG